MTNTGRKKFKDKLWHLADILNSAPDDASKATWVKKAMEAIEKENPRMDGGLPGICIGIIGLRENP